MLKWPRAPPRMQAQAMAVARCDERAGRREESLTGLFRDQVRSAPLQPLRLRKGLKNPRVSTTPRSGFGRSVRDGRLGEGFRAPALLRTVLQAPGPALESLPRRKPRGGWGLFFERAYGDLRNADGWRARRRRPAALGVFSGRDDGGCFRWRRWAGARRSHRSKEDWRPPADIALLFRRAAGGGGDRRCEAGWMATVMRCRS